MSRMRGITIMYGVLSIALPMLSFFGSGLCSTKLGFLSTGEAGCLFHEDLLANPSQENEPVRAVGQVQQPRIIKRVDPVYPKLAWQARVEALLVLEATIDEKGDVAQVHALHSHPLLEKAAVDAVKQWRFESTQFHGNPVKVITTITLPFKLEARMDANGKLVNPLGDRESVDELKIAGFSIVPAPDIPFDTLDRSLRSLWQRGFNFALCSPTYEFSGRLYYKASLLAIDSAVKPPLLDLDWEGLKELAKSPGSDLAATTITIFISEKGQISGIKYHFPPSPNLKSTRIIHDLGRLERILRNARIVAPAWLGNNPIPTAVELAIDLR